LQITQFLVGSAYAAIHLFVSYTVPVSIAYNVAEKVAPKLNTSSVSSAAASATSSVLEALPTATGVAVAFLRKLIYRAAGDEGLAENIAVPGQPLPYYQQQQQLAAGKPVEHPIEHFFHHPHETVNKVVYRTEYQSVPCLDTSGQAFAVYLNLIYLAPLTILFMRFFFKSYLRRTSPGAKHQTKHTAISKSARDATHGVEREIESLGKSAEDAVQLAVKKSRDAVRGRKTNANGKDDRHGSLSPANKKFVDEVKRKVSQKLQEIDETKDTVAKNVKQVANDFSEKAGQAAETVKEEAKEVKNKAEDESKPYIEKPRRRTDPLNQKRRTASPTTSLKAQNRPARRRTSRSSRKRRRSARRLRNLASSSRGKTQRNPQTPRCRNPSLSPSQRTSTTQSTRMRARAYSRFSIRTFLGKGKS
jgi:hypothetical protein